MDSQILFDLFDKTINAGKILNQDTKLLNEFQEILDQLPPMQIGKFGQLQEWMQDLDNPNDRHRHISHLYGLYPSSQISPYSTPELFAAAHNTLIQRGDISTGWSMGWKINFWARMLDGNHALKLITNQLTLVDPVRDGGQGGTYPNFFDAHPPFQIDGNFGCTSGITEMLMQTYDGAIHILPALPDNWKKHGIISGLKAYGGFEVSIEWEMGEVKKLMVISSNGGNCRIRLPNEMILEGKDVLHQAKGENSNPYFNRISVKKPLVADGAKLNIKQLNKTYLYDMETQRGNTYTLVKRP